MRGPGQPLIMGRNPAHCFISAVEWFSSSGYLPAEAVVPVSGAIRAEEGHAVRLRFIRTGRNTEMTPDRGAEQSGVSAAETGGWGEKNAKPEEGQTSPDVPSPTARNAGIAMLLYDGPAVQGGDVGQGARRSAVAPRGPLIPCHHAPGMPYSSHG